MDDLNQVCERLRSELEALYAADVWDCERINRIAGDLMHAQRAFTRVPPPREPVNRAAEARVASPRDESG